jgi:subtilisin family serine protease
MQRLPSFEVYGVAVRALAILAAVVAAGGVGLASDRPITWNTGAYLHEMDASPFVLRSASDPGGTVAGQGAQAIGAVDARNTYGLDGSGVRVGIISDSYDALGGAGAGIASGNLPGPGNPAGFTTPLTVVKEDLSPSSIDEGRAMAEIIHDVAPGAELLFHSAFNSPLPGAPPDQTIATAIDALVAAGADIIVDDVGILTAPVYQDGAAAQSADAAAAAGVAYYSAAGNNARNAYEADYNGLSGGAHDFDLNGNEGGDALFNVSVPAGGVSRFSLFWSDPYPSVGGAASSDYSMELLDGMGVVAVADQPQMTGADPYEFLSVSNSASEDVVVGLRLLHNAGPTGHLLKLFVYDADIVDEDHTFSPTVAGHPAAEGATAVAAQIFDPNAYNALLGLAPGDIEAFSSAGPARILFDPAGNAIDQARPGAELTAPDGVNTTFFGSAGLPDGDSLPNFFGTSAAAPHVAGVAALVLQRADQLGFELSVDLLNGALAATAEDLLEPGFDDLSGQGLIDALAAVEAIDLPGDANRDLKVGIEDLGILAGSWQNCGLHWEDGDFNGDGCVAIEDLGILAGNWSQGMGGVSVPEPASLVLVLGVGLPAVSARHRASRR